MKVLFVSSSKSAGGPGPIVKSQAISLENQGITVEHFTIFKKGLFGYLFESFRLRKELGDREYDIVHAHYGLSAITCLLTLKRKTLVVSFMGDDILGTNKNDGSISITSLILARVNRFLAKYFYTHSIVKSVEMLKYFGTDNVSLIPNGVDLEVFRPLDKVGSRRNLGFSLSEIIGIFVSDPRRVEKNFQLSSAAVKLTPHINIKLISVFQEDQSTLVEYYNSADFLILSSYHEGSPNVIKEAMACNCPIISTRVGDVEWVIKDTKGCTLADADPADMALKIVSVIEFSEKTGRTKGREKVIEKGLDSMTIAEKIIHVYNIIAI